MCERFHEVGRRFPVSMIDGESRFFTQPERRTFESCEYSGFFCDPSSVSTVQGQLRSYEMLTVIRQGMDWVVGHAVKGLSREVAKHNPTTASQTTTNGQIEKV